MLGDESLDVQPDSGPPSAKSGISDLRSSYRQNICHLVDKPLISIAWPQGAHAVGRLYQNVNHGFL